MFCLSKELNCEIENISYTGYAKSDVLFFDIETTGFSPETTILYMIGCIYWQQNRWICSQWFSDTKDSQADVLAAFIQLTRNYKVLICYNGQGFDIPYLQKKCAIYNVSSNLEKMPCLDIYKSIQPVRSLLKTENLKQKSIEVFLGINRKDKYSGGELIELYLKYLNNHSQELVDVLALHNHDDLVGMTGLLKILSYPAALKGQITVSNVSVSTYTALDLTEGKEITFEMFLPYPVPRRVSCGNDTFYLMFHGDTARLTVKAYTKELKYFYPNYKDYYYLPKEDTAIHKSVAFYVDKNFRTRAKAANCYSKKTGCFLPQYDEIICPYFKIDYYDKITYFEFTDEFKNNNEGITQYILHIMNKLMK